MIERIRGSLCGVEREENVRILFACESGSRAWGFPSADSDFDVRFLYVHPTEWYLRIDEGRDVIERPIDDALDASGWDVRKALRLLRRSNVPLLEWLGSPIVYRQDEDTVGQLRALAPICYSPVACFHHYLHMANGIYRDHLQGETVSAKKYLYVLRPVLALMWIEQGRGIVPTEFDVLVRAVLKDADVEAALNDLMDRKTRGSEADRELANPVLQGFIVEQLRRLETAAPVPPPRTDPTSELDNFFRTLIN